jgi:hypothetical protein
VRAYMRTHALYMVCKRVQAAAVCESVCERESEGGSEGGREGEREREREREREWEWEGGREGEREREREQPQSANLYAHTHTEALSCTCEGMVCKRVHCASRRSVPQKCPCGQSYRWPTSQAYYSMRILLIYIYIPICIYLYIYV